MLCVFCLLATGHSLGGKHLSPWVVLFETCDVIIYHITLTDFPSLSVASSQYRSSLGDKTCAKRLGVVPTSLHEDLGASSLV